MATYSVSPAILPSQTGNSGKFLTTNGINASWATVSAGSPSPLTTKGDLYVFSTIDARLPVGTNGQVLSADSSQATGLKWIAPPATAPGAPLNSFQWNSAGVFAGANSVYYDGVNDYFGAGINNTGSLTLSHPFQVGGGNSYAAPSISGTINYHSVPASPATATATATYQLKLVDPSSPAAVQQDFGGAFYLADGTNNFNYWVAAYKNVDGIKVFSPGNALVSFLDNSDMANFYVALSWTASPSVVSGYVVWVSGGIYSGYNGQDVGNVTSFNDIGVGWNFTYAYPPTVLGLSYNATGQTISYKIYDYLVADGVNLFSTTSKNLAFTDNNGSQHPPTSGTAVVNTSSGTYNSNSYNHQYEIWAQYADGGYSSTSLNKSVADTGPTAVADPVPNAAVQNSGGSGYFASGYSMNYQLVAYKYVSGGCIYSPGVSTISFTDDSSFTGYSVYLSWAPSVGADGYILFISGGPHFYTYYSQNIGNVTSYYDSDSGWNLQYPYPMTTMPDPSFISAVQNDAETGYTANGTNAFNIYVAAYVSGASGYIVSPGSTTTVFTDNNDSSTFGIDINWASVTAPANGKPADAYYVYITGTTPYNTGYFIQNIVGTSLIDQATGWSGGATYPPPNSVNRYYTYQVQLSWASVPLATNYLILKAGGDSGWSYDHYINQAGTSINDTDDSIWTASYAGTNPPTPVEQPLTYDIHVSHASVGGVASYYTERDVNGGGYTTFYDVNATSFIDGNNSFTWSSSPSTVNTLFLADGSTHTNHAYSYSNSDAVYSPSFGTASVTDDNSGRFYSISWTAPSYPAGADKLKLITDGTYGELLTSPTLTYKDINQSYNSNTTVTPNTVPTRFYADRYGAVNVDSLTAATYIDTPKVGTGTGIFQLGVSAASSGADAIAFGTSSTASAQYSVALGTGTTASSAGNIALGHLANAHGGVSAIAIGDTSVANGTAAIAVGPGASAINGNSLALGYAAISSNAGTAIGYNSGASGSLALAMLSGSVASGGESIAIGVNSAATSTHTIVIGSSSGAGTNFDIAIGYACTSNGGNCVSLGFGTSATGNNAICIGSSTQGTFDRAVGIGYNARGNGIEAVALGTSALAQGTDSIALGAAARSHNDNSVTLGANTTVSANNGIAIGSGASVGSTSASSIALGIFSTVGTSSGASAAIGYSNTINNSSPNSYAFGQGNAVTGNAAFAFGQNNTITNNSSMGIGFSISSPPASTILIQSVAGIRLQSTSSFVYINEKLGIKNLSPSALLELGTAGTTLGTMGISGNTSGRILIQPAAAAGTWTWTLPTTGGTNLYTLQTNGSGTTTWAQVDVSTAAITGTLPVANGGTGTTKPQATLFNHHVDAGNTTTTETTLYTDTIAASQLGANDDKLEATYGGVFVSSATATREIKIYFGGTVMLDTGALTLSLSSAWTAYVTIIRVSSSVVRYAISFTTEGAALAAYTAVGEITGLTLSNTQILKITGQAAGVGAATSDVLAKLGYVEYKPA